MNPGDLVRRGYDQLGTAYHAHFAPLHTRHYSEWLTLFKRHVPVGTAVLELGCGDGRPVAGALAPDYGYTGVDFSATQIAAAKLRVPTAQFVLGDMILLQLPRNRYGGLIALYSIIHVPLERQYRLLQDIHGWLSAGGIFMATLGAGEWTGVAQDWITPGTPMYWSHTTSDEYARWLESIGFELLEQRIIPEGDACHTFFLARKPAQGAKPQHPARR